MKIYTKTGDQGTTALLGGSRVPKHHLRLACYGTLDELNSWLGLLRDMITETQDREMLLRTQKNLFIAGASLALDPDKKTLKNGKPRLSLPELGNEEILILEREIDHMEDSLPKMTHFILPGGHPTVSNCHIARTVCRRAERHLSALHELEAVDLLLLAYLNRLSDYLFVLARKLSKDLQLAEIKWIPEGKN